MRIIVRMLRPTEAQVSYGFHPGFGDETHTPGLDESVCWLALRVARHNHFGLRRPCDKVCEACTPSRRMTDMEGYVEFRKLSFGKHKPYNLLLR